MPVVLGGVLMVVSAVAHALLGWPVQRGGLGVLGTPSDLVSSLSAGWYFGSVSMTAFGALTLIAGGRMKRHDFSGVAFVRVVAAAYIIFGCAAFIVQGFNPHFLGFVALGGLAGIPVIGLSHRSGNA
jgi:hypothetical protein